MEIVSSTDSLLYISTPNSVNLLACRCSRTCFPLPSRQSLGIVFGEHHQLLSDSFVSHVAGGVVDKGKKMPVEKLI